MTLDVSRAKSKAEKKSLSEEKKIKVYHFTLHTTKILRPVQDISHLLCSQDSRFWCKFLQILELEVACTYHSNATFPVWL